MKPGIRELHFNWNDLGPSQGPQSREQNWLLYPRLLHGVKKVCYHIHELSRCFYCWAFYSMIYSERGLPTAGGKRTLENLGPPRDHLASPMNCWPPLPAVDLAIQQMVLRPVGPIASIIKKKWMAQTYRQMEDTRGKDHSSRNNWQDSSNWPPQATHLE